MSLSESRSSAVAPSDPVLALCQERIGYVFRDLDPGPFQHLHQLSDAELARLNIQRVRVDEKPGAPCRISLDDAEIGEAALLLSYEHLPYPTPYRQQGPIFIRETNARFDAVDRMPPALARRDRSQARSPPGAHHSAFVKKCVTHLKDGVFL